MRFCLTFLPASAAQGFSAFASSAWEASLTFDRSPFRAIDMAIQARPTPRAVPEQRASASRTAQSIARAGNGGNQDRAGVLSPLGADAAPGDPPSPARPQRSPVSAAPPRRRRPGAALFQSLTDSQKTALRRALQGPLTFAGTAWHDCRGHTISAPIVRALRARKFLVLVPDPTPARPRGHQAERGMAKRKNQKRGVMVTTAKAVEALAGLRPAAFALPGYSFGVGKARPTPRAAPEQRASASRTAQSIARAGNGGTNTEARL